MVDINCLKREGIFTNMMEVLQIHFVLLMITLFHEDLRKTFQQGCNRLLSRSNNLMRNGHFC